MNRLSCWLIAIAVFTGLCWLFPLFHIVPLKRAEQEKAAATFNSAKFAETFWRERLLTSLDKAVSCDVLLPAIRGDVAAARTNFSHRVGISESYIYFITGKGRVLAVSDDDVGIAVTEGATAPEISLRFGPVFGNAIRDGTGLLDVNEFPNSQDFNGISEALNRIVENEVLSKLHAQAKVGAVLRFTGCAEVNDESSDLKPLRVVPISIE